LCLSTQQVGPSGNAFDLYSGGVPDLNLGQKTSTTVMTFSSVPPGKCWVVPEFSPSLIPFMSYTTDYSKSTNHSTLNLQNTKVNVSNKHPKVITGKRITV